MEININFEESVSLLIRWSSLTVRFLKVKFCLNRGSQALPSALDGIIIDAIMFKLIAGAVLLLCVGGLGLSASITQFAIVDAVNEKLPTSEQFQHLGWYLTKTSRLHREYRRLYPTGNLLRRQRILSALALVCLIVAASLIFISND